MAVFQAKTFQKVSSSAFSNAKKLADLRLKQLVDGKKNPTAQAYKEAMAIIEQFQFSPKESESLDAQRLMQGYENSLEKLLVKESGRRKSVGEAKLDEKNAYYASATGVKAGFIASGDILGLVSFQRESLNEHLFKLYDSISLAEQDGEDASSLYSEVSDVFRRYKDIERLEDDLLDGNGSSLGEYGVFIDSDKNGIDGIFVAKANDLPSGIDKGKYVALDETSALNGVEGANIPVYGEFFVDPIDNKKKVVIGNREWSLPSGVTGNLRYNSKSDPSYVSNAKKGSFSVADFTVKNNPVASGGRYFTGITGYDDEGNLKKTLFMSPDGQKMFSVDDETMGRLKQDANEANEIDKAFKRNELDSKYVREVVIPNAKPYQIETMTTPQQSQVVPGLSPDVRGFSVGGGQELNYGSALKSGGLSTPEFFGNRVNRPSKPEESKGEEGFLKKAVGFFTSKFSK